MITPIDQSFFNKPTLQLSKDLLGCRLVHLMDNIVISGRIVETEAYMGPVDRAAHSFQNRRTKRTEIMYHEAGLIYTYQMHTHTLINIVSGNIDCPEAVLIRAIEPIDGIDYMIQMRNNQPISNLTNGPGKLTKAMNITMSSYGQKSWEPPVFIAEGTKPHAISSGPRIGIENTGEARDYPWRFWITDNPFISRK
ncbi:DNA-3-methyladenine glycosylase [Gottfriedia solisilvae]|uniref:Putative 3-methyladenine DNA glycosylase n=1 Tax=Gottfriedia solisilvae TaxID=1516104 RepID=A0A8J3AKI0_9BACI|nr:DNA-3-methyladenine glycosylase [Gottfriedia solisilvae]GGI15535.1 putative 3-methyladenine DNA glycosylase [Gottfriedia solisilvae]